MRFIIAASVLFSAVSITAANAKMLEREIPLRIEKTSAVTARNGMIEIFRNLPRQKPGEPQVTLEAENYNDVFWQGVSQETTSSEDLLRNMESRGKLKAYNDPKASGGKYLERMTTATYCFSIADPGEYTIWYRFYMPRKATWIFRQHLSRHKPESVKLSGPVKQWFWQKGKTYKMDKRSYRLQIADFHNGKRLDKIVLSRDPDFKPSGTGPPRTLPSKRLRFGRVDFAPVAIAADAKNVDLKFSRLNKQGILTVRYSLDNGKTWKIKNPNEKLELPRNGACEVMFQITFKADRARKYPEITLPQLVYEQSANDFAVLENANVRYVFDRKTGDIDSISLLKPKLVPIKLPDSGSPVFRLLVKPDNNSSRGGTWLASGDFKLAEFTSGKTKVVCRYRNLKYKLDLSATYRLNKEGYLDTDLAVVNAGKDDVLEVVFPIVDQVRIGPSAMDDTLIWPLGTGKKYPAPVSKSAQTAYYPRAGLGFFALFDSGAGFYMANHDPGLYSTVMNAAPDESRTWMNFSFTRRNRIKANGGKVDYKFAVGAHPEDWHQGALWYRNWYLSVFPKFKKPDWIAESNGWLFENLVHTQPHMRYKYLPDMTFCRAIIYGLPHVQIWGTDGVSSCPTYFMPPKFLGGPEGMTQASEWWSRYGGKVGYYLLGQGPSAWFFSDNSKAYLGTPWKDMPDWSVPPGKKQGKSWQWLVENARYDRPDCELRYSHGSAKKPRIGRETDRSYPWDYMPMSNYSKPWNDFFSFWIVDKYLRDWGCKTVYLDTFHTQADNPDYNPYMKFHGEGQGGKMRSELAKRIFEEGRKIDPDFLPVMEMQCDAYTPWMAIQCSSSSKDTEMYKFTHPDCVYFQGHTAQGTRGLVRFARFSSCWLYGNLFDHRLSDDWTWEVIKMRQWVTRWINAARFIDDVGMKIKAPELKGKIHRVLAKDGTKGFLVNFWNTARREWPAENKTLSERPWYPYKIRQELVPLSKIGKAGAPESWIPKRAFLIEMGKEPRRFEFKVKRGSSGPYLEYEVPPTQLSGVLFVCDAKGPFQYLARSQQRGFKELDVKIFNVTGHELPGSVKLDSPDFSIEPDKQDFKAVSGVMTTLKFPYPGGKPPVLASYIGVKIDAGKGSERTLRGAAYPFLDDASFEVCEWRDYSPDSCDGKRSMLVKPGKGERLSFRFEPDTKYRLRFKVKGQDGVKGMAVIYLNWKGASGRFDGKDLFISKRARYDGKWKTVEMTFLTPPMCFEMPMNIRASRNAPLLVDNVTLEKLPAAAKVQALPDYNWKKPKSKAEKSAVVSRKPVRGGKIKEFIQDGWPEKISAKTGDLEVAFDAAMHWGLRLVKYRDEVLGMQRPGISYGTVVKIRGLGFVGAGHVTKGHQEQVQKLVLKIDGKPVKKPASNYRCKSAELFKESKIEDFRLKESWLAGNDRIIQKVMLKVEKPVTTDLVYFFMYPFVPQMTSYLAETLDGKKVDGEFAGNKSFKVNKPVKWVGEYNAKTGFGAVVRITHFPDDVKWMIRLWDRPRAYKKHYLMTLRGRRLRGGETFKFSAVVLPFQAAKDKWKSKAESLGKMPLE